MCYPKPGPRCAAHLRTQIKQLRAKRDAAIEAFATGQDLGDPAKLARELDKAEEEYAETRTQRDAAAAKIAAMRDGKQKSDAVAALEAAAARYQTKVDAYRAVRDAEARDLLRAEEEVHLGAEIQTGLAATELLGMDAAERREHIAALPEALRATLTNPATGQCVDDDALDGLTVQGSTAQSRLVESNIGLVHFTLKRFSPEGRRTHGVDDHELLSAAHLSLFEAARRWKPGHGAKFSTYAVKCIHYGLLKVCSANTDTVMRLPSGKQDDWRRVRQLHESFRLSETPWSDTHAAAVLNLHPNDVAQYRKIPLRSGTRDVHDPYYADQIADMEAQSPHTVAASREVSERTHALLDTLNEREAGIVAMRHGLAGEEPKTYDQVAAMYGVTRERVRQIEKHAMDKLRFTANRTGGYRDLLLDAS